MGDSKMPWLTRKGREYFYFSKRDANGKSQKIYFGSGYKGLLAEITLRDIARRRAAALAERDDFIAQVWSLTQMQRLAKCASREALHAAYYLCGFRQTTCHHWKKESLMIPKMSDLPFESKAEALAASKLSVDSSSGDALDEVANSVTKPKPVRNSFWPSQIEETLAEIKSGRRDLLPLLREQLAAVPDRWQKVSDMTHLSIHGWAKQIAGDDEIALRESIVIAATAERDELLSKCKTVMERVVVDRFVIAKIQIQYYDMASSQSAGSLVDSKLSIEIAKRQRSAAYQYSEAIRQLRKIRDLQDQFLSDGEANESANILKLYAPDKKTA